MKIYVSCTANLGDFFNSFPVISGISKAVGQKIHLLIRPEMRKFVGIKELISYQAFVERVDFYDDVILYNTPVLDLSSWTRTDRNSINRPIETCRYENWVIDNYQLKFEVDDDFELQVPKLDIDYLEDKILIGDRWSVNEDPTLDTRRKSYVIKDSGNYDSDVYKYLDFSNDIVYNLSIIKYNPNPFYSTFTGIAVLANLMKKETVVLWDEDMRNWIDRPIELTFDSHFYKDRKINVKYIKD